MRIPAADRTLAFLGYLPFLFWIPIKARKQSMFAQFHGRQSYVLWLMWFAICILLLVFLFFLPDDLQSSLSVTVFATMYLASAIYIVMMVIGMWKVGLGERYRMPVVAGLALRMGL